ncbi:uncharacterized protein LOC141720233 [Apium graveolens]|uniref:uncharacterized protein LOC141720233 n=1 Tax=Apium graveolens TaxID=4045 RepID=UPI003D7A7960
MGGKTHHNKFLRIITLPFRFLKKGKDMYVKSMMDVASKPRYVSSHNMMGSRNKSSKASSALPKSFSTSYANSFSSTNFEGDDLKELIRANSTTYNNDPSSKLRMDMDLYLKQLIKEQQVKKLKESLVLGNNRFASSQGVVPRSVSVGMGKIDEEKPFEEEEEEEEEDSVQVKKKKEVMFPRSRSHAVSQTTAVF